MPYTISIPSLEAIVVHAGLVPNRVLSEQLADDMHSMRNLVAARDSKDEPLVGTTSNSEGVPWASLWRHSPHVFFGHDARRGLQLHEHCTGLDTGCVYGQCTNRVTIHFHHTISR